MLGYEEHELSNDPDEWFKRVHPYYLPELKESLSAHIYGKTKHLQHQYRMQHRDGTHLWILTRGLALRDESGNPIAVAGSQIDITDLVEVEKSIVDDAFRDKLTGLANKRACLVRLDSAVDRLQRSGAYLFAVLFLDLDRFKVINDNLGHLVGDQLLAAVASRLRGCVRERSGDMIARFFADTYDRNHAQKKPKPLLVKHGGGLLLKQRAPLQALNAGAVDCKLLLTRRIGPLSERSQSPS